MLLQNKVNINDWSSVQSLFDKLNKQLEKTQKVTDALGVPRVYVRILVELEDNLKKTLADKDAKKKMSPTNAKALNTMRQRLKKHNVAFQEQIDKFRENPESTEEEPSDDSELDSDSDDGSDEEEQEDADVDGFEKVLLQSVVCCACFDSIQMGMKACFAGAQPIYCFAAQSTVLFCRSYCERGF